MVARNFCTLALGIFHDRIIEYVIEKKNYSNSLIVDDRDIYQNYKASTKNIGLKIECFMEKASNQIN